ncbi:Uracil-DNA glycosylase, C-terminal domain protein [Sulfitobacter noctilucicola]|uniref:Type-4 uracil-DNA glycosylase n=1 Tax=Sulfitobacter noctilucicola TaxID=1342301 RepID=A0A7W6M6I4_9RHOB|nr:uracil-DNA glycosylase [Sulfitobacter noctilucicola]KIN62113.1 Uracil-DNA glycosylase, C-terminal domain protein [Sulfitobacter noctilucicola]MBB4173368.1 DNA polymerase [Sulfitobacter noctilucicola]
MESAEFYHHLALLDWQVELGVTEAIMDTPVDRYALPDAMEKPSAVSAASPSVMPIKPASVDPVAVATQAAQAAQSLEELRAAMEAFEHCTLKKGARNMVFSDGVAGARVMLIGEAPGRDEDRAGKPFVGAAGQLLDKMLGAINMGRDHAQAPVYITNVLPWRPPQNRDPKPDEIAMMKPFLLRHIELASPDVLVIIGNWACQALLGKKGITRLRGEWTQAANKPALPMFHPAYLLRSPEFKREAWADLLSLQARLRDG